MDKALARRMTRKELVEKGQSIGQFCFRLILKGQSTAEVLKAVKAKWPKAETSAACVAYYRTALRKGGYKVPEPARAPAPAVVEAPKAKGKAKKGKAAA